MRVLTLLGVVMGMSVVGAAALHEDAGLAAAGHAAMNVGQNAGPSVGQEEEEAVVAAVERLFEAMRTSDSTLARSVFHPTARLGRATETGIEFNGVDGFIGAIGRPKAEIWDEPVWDWTVQVDGRLAQMWTKYAFYLGETFSHCGVDALELYKSPSGWQVTQLVDTSREEDCWYPPGRAP